MKAKTNLSESQISEKGLITPEKNSSSVTKKKILVKKKKVTPKENPPSENSEPEPKKKVSQKKEKEKNSSPKLEKLPGSLPNPLNIRKSSKELKYKYPEGLSKQEMKKHRLKLRKKLKSLQEELLKLTQGTSEFEEKSKELENFMQTNYNL